MEKQPGRTAEETLGSRGKSAKITQFGAEQRAAAGRSHKNNGEQQALTAGLMGLLEYYRGLRGKCRWKKESWKMQWKER